MSSMMSFRKAITLFQDYLDYLANTNNTAFHTTQFEVFDLNTVEEIQRAIRSASYEFVIILEYMYYVFFNGSEILLSQLASIEERFISSILDRGWRLIYLLKVMMISCSCVNALLFLFYIPYFLSIEQA